MIKKVLVAIMFVGALLTASPVMAEDKTECVTVTQYGGAVSYVCGKHTPVETGLADINPVVLASAFLSLSSFAYIKAKKLAKASIAL